MFTQRSKVIRAEKYSQLPDGLWHYHLLEHPCFCLLLATWPLWACFFFFSICETKLINRTFHILEELKSVCVKSVCVCLAHGKYLTSFSSYYKNTIITLPNIMLASTSCHPSCSSVGHVTDLNHSFSKKCFNFNFWF